MSKENPKQETAVTQLAPANMKPAEAQRNVWHVTPEAGTPIEALLDPKYWAHVSMKFRPRDRIEVDAEDGEYFAYLMVLDAGRLYAKVELIHKVAFKSFQVQGAENAEYEVKYRGPAQKWCVVRKADKSVMRAQFETKEQGVHWMNEHAKAMAA